MADVKISQLPAATTPLDGTEVLPIVQSATTKQVSIANVTAGRAMAASSLTLTTPLAVTSGGTGLSTTAAGTLLSSTALNTVSATATPTLGVAGTTAGTLTLSGGTSGTVTLKTALAAGTNTIFQFPATNGTNNYILTTNGSGVTDWTNPTALGIDLDVGGTAITGGVSGRVLYDNAGVLGEYTVTGTAGNVVLSTSPTLATPTFTTSFTSPLHIGGTTASSSLTLQSTSGVGTSDSILLKVGNNGATTAATVDTLGNVTLGTATLAPTQTAGGSMAMTGTLAMGSSFLRNKIINGNFDFWQRGTSFSVSAPTFIYYADRWYGGGTLTFSRQSFTNGQTDVPNNPTYYAQINITSDSANYGTGQKIEDVRTLAGLPVAVSFYMRRTSGTVNFTARLLQNFGTGGSPSALTSTSLGTPSLTSSWQKFTYTATLPSISGKTIGTNNDSNLELSFLFGSGTGVVEIAQVQVEQGAVVTAFEMRPYQQELALCQRYLPYFSNTSGSSNTYLGVGPGASATAAYPMIPFLVQARVAPTGITSSGTFTMVTGSTSVTLSSVAFNTADRSAGLITATAASGLTNGFSYLLQFPVGSYIYFTGCEL